jgi:hypothetical protein
MPVTKPILGNAIKIVSLGLFIWSMFLPVIGSTDILAISGPQGGKGSYSYEPETRFLNGGEIAWAAPEVAVRVLMGHWDFPAFMFALLWTFANGAFLAAWVGSSFGWQRFNRLIVKTSAAISLMAGLASIYFIIDSHWSMSKLSLEFGYFPWIASPAILFVLPTPRARSAAWLLPCPPLPVKENNPH